MKLVKKNKRKEHYHSTKCMVVKEYGEDYFMDIEDTNPLSVDVDCLEECSHCQGIERKSGDRSYYLTAKRIGEQE